MTAGRHLILITSSYYWPEWAGNAPYVAGLAEHLAGRGHEVIVATGFAHYPHWTSGAAGRLRATERRGGVEIHRRWHYVPRVQSAWTRAIYEATLAVSGLTALPRRRPDLVLGVCPTFAAASLAWIAASVYRRPFGLIVQDLVGAAARQSGVEGAQRIARLVEISEAHVARRATAIGIIAEGFRSYFERRGVAPERIRRLRNWSLPETPSEARQDVRRRLGWESDDVVVLHAGNMGHKQGLENVLHAARLLHGRDLRIVLAGDGNERQRLEQQARGMALTNVSFLPPQPPGRYEAMLQAADILLVNQRHLVADMSLPSKLTSYFQVGRPVVAAVAPHSETAAEVRAAGAGVVVPPNDPAALAEALLGLLASDGVAAYGARAQEFAREHLTPDAVFREYDAFVDLVARGRS